jgi:hypothetical protein
LKRRPDMAANYRFQLKRPNYMKGIGELPKKMVNAITNAARTGQAQSDEDEAACSQAIMKAAEEIKQAKHLWFRDIEILPREPHLRVKHRWQT